MYLGHRSKDNLAVVGLYMTSVDAKNIVLTSIFVTEKKDYSIYKVQSMLSILGFGCSKKEHFQIIYNKS